MTQPWIASLYLDCANAGMRFWPQLGSGVKAGSSSLHCPNATSVAAFRAALQRGDIFVHAFAHNAEASTYADASMFEAGIEIGERLADESGIPRPTAVSQRDVPGWTRATLPLLKRHGVVGLSFGAGTPPGKVDVPPLCVWRDVATDSEVVLTYETAYGTVATLFVLPTGEALAAAWAGDNTGPPSLADVQGFYDTLHKKYPSAKVVASTLDAFFVAANQPEVKAKLPIVTAEIEDAWIHGVPADPLKNAQFREASRQRLKCLKSGTCSKNSRAMQAFDRLLLQVPEHTAGVAHVWFFMDNENYTNAQFDKARAQQPLGFIADNRKQADYNTSVNSWLEQRAFITQAPALLESEYPELAANLTSALDSLKAVEPPSSIGMTPVNPLNATFTCGGTELTVGSTGELVSLKRNNVQWASRTNAVGQYLYETYTEADYKEFLLDLGSRIGDTGMWPDHTAGPYAHYTDANSSRKCADDVSFCKANMTAANPQHRSLHAAVDRISVNNDNAAEVDCEILIESTLPAEARTFAGAPKSVVTKLTVSANGTSLDWDVFQVDKRPTRLPESSFFTFNPEVPDPRRWELTVLGSPMDPHDVIGKHFNGSDRMSTYLKSQYGGSPHLRGAESAHYTGANPKTSGGARRCAGGFELTSLDVPVVCTGRATPFVTPRTEAPDMTEGVSWNIHQNIWNTNYVQWYPYDGVDRHIRSRFRMELC